MRPAAAEWQSGVCRRAQLTAQDVEGGIQERDAARKAKDFARGDSIRAALAEKGIMLCDGPAGTTWRPGARLEPEKARR